MDFCHVLEMNEPHPFFLTLVQLVIAMHDVTSAVSHLVLCCLKKLECLTMAIEVTKADDVEHLFVEMASSCLHDTLIDIESSSYQPSSLACLHFEMPLCVQTLVTY
jgi:hypothetical protein